MEGIKTLQQAIQHFGDKENCRKFMAFIFASDSIRIAERYVKGELYLLLTFTIAGCASQYVSLIQARSLDKGTEGCESPSRIWPTGEHDFLSDVNCYRHEEPVFVSVIQSVENPEVVSVPSTVRFYRVDELFSFWRHAICFSFRIGHVLLGTLADREIDKLRIFASTANKFSGQIIESTPEILDSISGDGGEVSGHGGEWPHDAFSNVSFGIELGYDYIRIGIEKCDSFPIKLTDVILSPLNFSAASC